MEGVATLVLVGVEFSDRERGVDLGRAGSIETVVGTVEVVGGGADGGWVSSGPALPYQSVVVGDGAGQVSLCGSALADRLGEPGSGVPPLGLSVGG
jgi:hypothetical protein